MKGSIVSILTLILTFTLYTSQAQTTTSGESEAMMGFARAVDVADGSVFIGEPANVHQPGLVYVFRRTGGSWAQQFSIQASDGQIGDGFGSALQADGSRLLAGAPSREDGRGAAYLFEMDSEGAWNQVARIAPADTGEFDFGSSVALNGDLAFVGAPGEKDGVGAVYVYERDDSGTWNRQARLANPDTARGTDFGSALAAGENRLLVGAPDDQGGAVYAFGSDGMGNWTLESTLASDRIGERAAFGSTLSLRGDEVLIGAPGHDAASGAVFLFRREAEGGTWSPAGRLLGYDGGPFYRFGSSLAFVGSDAWIGAPNADGGRGALYRYERTTEGEGWAAARKFDGPERGEGDSFAGTFEVDGNVAVAGLTGADYGAGTAAIMERSTGSGEWTVHTTVIPESGSVLEAVTGNRVDCSDGEAGLFQCSNVDMLSFLPIEDIGGERGVRLNDIWGWTDPQTGKEYALVGRNEGTSFVDVSNPTNPVYVATLPKPESSEASVWRDIKVYDNHAFVVADNAGEHGMQVVDLTDLRDYEGSPLQMEEVAHYDGIHSAHNVVINTDSGFAYVVGSSGGGQTCGGGLHMVNIQDPANPTFAGCFSDPSTGRSGTGYSHDAQCVNYHGPDQDYQGREICIGANETAISIADVTDKENPRAVSTASYPDYGYVHQGWLTEDHRYFIQNDELDELSGTVDQTRTLIWDLTDLDDPQFVREYMLDNSSSDHNLYIREDLMFQSNYVSGLQVFDISDPANPVKTGEFDTLPFGEDTPGFAGTWSNYPFFESGIVIMTSGREGLFVLQPQKRDL